MRDHSCVRFRKYMFQKKKKKKKSGRRTKKHIYNCLRERGEDFWRRRTQQKRQQIFSGSITVVVTSRTTPSNIVFMCWQIVFKKKIVVLRGMVQKVGHTHKLVDYHTHYEQCGKFKNKTVNEIYRTTLFSIFFSVTVRQLAYKQETSLWHNLAACILT